MESSQTNAHCETVQTERGELSEERASVSWTPEQIQLLNDILPENISDKELRLFKYVCQKTGLDPFMRQIHIVKRWDAGRKREVATFQTGIDGYRVIAERSCEYAGSDKPVFVYRTKKEIEELKKQNLPIPKVNLQSASVTVYRMVQGQRVGYNATAYWDEYAQYDRNGDLSSFWSRMPRGQLAKCAEALALRKAFPANLSGLYTNEEMQQADNSNRGRNANGTDRGSSASKMVTGNGDRFCWFCKNRHIKKGDQILRAPIKDAGADRPVWGAIACWEKLRRSDWEQMRTDTGDTRLLYTKEQIIKEIEVLECQLSDVMKQLGATVESRRRTYCGKTDLKDATLPGLKNYLMFLGKQSDELTLQH